MCFWKPGELIVQHPDDGESMGRLREALRFESVDITPLNKLLDDRDGPPFPKDYPFTFAHVKVPEGREGDALFALGRMADSRIVAEPNYFFATSALPAPRVHWNALDHKTYLDMLRVPHMHALGATGKGIKIAVLDSGEENAKSGINLLQHGALPEDQFGHGSAVSSIIHSVAPAADIDPIKIVDAQGQTDSWLLLAGLTAAWRRKTHIVNVSLSYTLSPAATKCGMIAPVWVRSQILEQLICAFSESMVVVVAAGNKAQCSLPIPASCHCAIPIVSVNKSGIRSAFSNYPPAGVDYWTCTGGDGAVGAAPTEWAAEDEINATKYAGTSMAAAYASGVLALHWLTHPFAGAQLPKDWVRTVLVRYHTYNLG